MKLSVLIVSLSVYCLCDRSAVIRADDSFEDSEFSEFDFDLDDELDTGEGVLLSNYPPEDEEVEVRNPITQGKKMAEFATASDDDDGLVEDDEDNEFEHFHDEEEFEGYDAGDAKDIPPDHRIPEPKLTVAKIPLHFRTHWDSYWMEMLMLAGLTAYFANFFVGKSKNSKLAHLWLNTHRSMLEENFALVGDDGKVENENPGLYKESESLYTLWCSGRTCCEGMLVELRMIKRQDLVALVAGLMRPQQDQLHIKVEISKDCMDSFVFCVGVKKTVTKFFKELSDLSKYCVLVNKPEDRYNVPSGFSVLSEIPEATSAFLESSIVGVFRRYPHIVEYVHISDQFSGPIQQEDPNNLKQPEVKRMLMVGLNYPKDCDMDSVKPVFFVLVFYIMEKLKTFRLSKDGKAKAEKNRLRVEEEFLKSTHAARAEAAAQRREDKRKQEKERVLAEDDPEKQRRWELKEQKRQAKKKAPKMKRLAVKSL